MRTGWLEGGGISKLVYVTSGGVLVDESEIIKEGRGEEEEWFMAGLLVDSSYWDRCRW